MTAEDVVMAVCTVFTVLLAAAGIVLAWPGRRYRIEPAATRAELDALAAQMRQQTEADLASLRAQRDAALALARQQAEVEAVTIHGGPTAAELETLIRQALARGYTYPENGAKVLDPALILAMTAELVKVVRAAAAAPPAPPKPAPLPPAGERALDL